MTQIAVGCLGFSSLSIGRISSWAELRALHKEKQSLLKKGCRERAEQRRWIREVRTEMCNGWAGRAGNPEACDDREELARLGKR